MLRVRRYQLAALAQTHQEEFFEYVKDYIEKEFPNIAEEKGETILNWIIDVYIEAKSYGLSTKRDHIKYINYKCIFGDNFANEYKFVAPILTSNETAKSKLAKLKEKFLDALDEG